MKPFKYRCVVSAGGDDDGAVLNSDSIPAWPWQLRLLRGWTMALATLASAASLIGIGFTIVNLVQGPCAGYDFLCALLSSLVAFLPASVFLFVAHAVWIGRRKAALKLYLIASLMTGWIVWPFILWCLLSHCEIILVIAIVYFPVLLLKCSDVVDSLDRLARRDLSTRGLVVLLTLFVLGLIAFPLMPFVGIAHNKARRAEMAKSGHIILQALATNDAARARGENAIDSHDFTNSTEYLSRVLEAAKLKMRGPCFEFAEWTVAEDVPEEAENFPVLFSANVDVMRIPRAWNGEYDGVIDLSKVRTSDYLGHTGLVVCRDGREISLIKNRFYKYVFGKPYELKETTTFLTPQGRTSLINPCPSAPANSTSGIPCRPFQTSAGERFGE